MSDKNKYLVIIAGPTAVGKTALSIHLAKHYNTVILSADSRQFYREMTIGTAKPTREQLNEVKHFFIDTKNINELYGAGHFEKDAAQLLENLFKEKNIVIMTGGSGLYINAVLHGVDEFIEVPSEIRNELNLKFENLGINWLRDQLKELDPLYHSTVDLNNPQRIIRALEVSVFTGKPYSSFLKKNVTPKKFTAIRILINTKREDLYRKINERTEQMMAQGLLEEVKKLEAFKHMNALKTVGYRELFEYLDSKTTLAEAVEKIKQHTRNYAKRQITWFKNQDQYEEFDPADTQKIIAYIDSIARHG